MKKSRCILNFASPEEYEIYDVLRIGKEYFFIVDRGFSWDSRRQYHITKATFWERFTAFFKRRIHVITVYRDNRKCT